MSMTTLRLIQESIADHDNWVDQRQKHRQQTRNVKLEGKALEEQGEKLYKKVVEAVKKGEGSAQVSCKVRSNCVFKYVVDKLNKKGFKAKHSFNDGYNDYDFISVKPNIDRKLKGL